MMTTCGLNDNFRGKARVFMPSNSNRQHVLCFFNDYHHFPRCHLSHRAGPSLICFFLFFKEKVILFMYMIANMVA